MARGRFGSRLRGVAMRAVVVVAAWAVLFAFVRSGKRVYYCPIADRSYDTPPCEGQRTSDPAVPTIGPRDCCQVKWRPAPPSTETPTDGRPDVGPAGTLDALYASPLDIATAAAKVPFGIVHAVRAGPPPPFAGERRAELMVFHI